MNYTFKKIYLNDEGEKPLELKIIFGTLFCIVIIVGVPSNIVTATIFGRTSPKTAIDWLLLTVSVMDAIVCLFSPILYLLSLFFEAPLWNIELSCTFAFWLQSVGMIASSILLVVIALDRYIKVCQPNRTSLTPIQSRKVSVLCVLAAATFSSFIFLVRLLDNDCYAGTKHHKISWADRFFTSSLFIIFAITFVTLAFTYGNICIKIRAKVKLKRRLMLNKVLKSSETDDNTPDFSPQQTKEFFKFMKSQENLKNSNYCRVLCCHKINCLEYENNENCIVAGNYGNKSKQNSSVKTMAERHHLNEDATTRDGLEQKKIIDHINNQPETESLENNHINNPAETEVLENKQIDVIKQKSNVSNNSQNNEQTVFVLQNGNNKDEPHCHETYSTDVLDDLCGNNQETEKMIDNFSRDTDLIKGDTVSFDSFSVENNTDVVAEDAEKNPHAFNDEVPTPTFSNTSQIYENNSKLNSQFPECTVQETLVGMGDDDFRSDVTIKQPSAFPSNGHNALENGFYNEFSEAVQEEACEPTNSINVFVALDEATNVCSRETTLSKQQRQKRAENRKLFVRERQMTLMLFFMTATFLISWIPPWIIYLIFLYTPVGTIQSPVVPLITGVHLLNYMATPTIYYLFNETFRSKVDVLLSSLVNYIKCCNHNRSDSVDV